MNLEPQSMPPVSTPRPFREITALWWRLPDMTEAFFTQEAPHASMLNASFGILIYCSLAEVLMAVLVGLGSMVHAPATADGGIGVSTAGGAMTAVFLCGLIFFIAPLSFFAYNAITCGFALLAGGKGKFSTQVYLTSLYFVPLGLLFSFSDLLLRVLEIGFGLFFALLEFPIFLLVGCLVLVYSVRALKVVYGFSTRRALAVGFAPSCLLLLPLILTTLTALPTP